MKTDKWLKRLALADVLCLLLALGCGDGREKEDAAVAALVSAKPASAETAAAEMAAAETAAATPEPKPAPTGAPTVPTAKRRVTPQRAPLETPSWTRLWKRPPHSLSMSTLQATPQSDRC